MKAPVAIGPAAEVQQPFATVVIGGPLATTPRRPLAPPRFTAWPLSRPRPAATSASQKTAPSPAE